jgi:hypothetical protein
MNSDEWHGEMPLILGSSGPRPCRNRGRPIGCSGVALAAWPGQVLACYCGHPGPGDGWSMRSGVSGVVGGR